MVSDQVGRAGFRNGGLARATLNHGEKHPSSVNNIVDNNRVDDGEGRQAVFPDQPPGHYRSTDSPCRNGGPSTRGMRGPG